MHIKSTGWYGIISNFATGGSNMNVKAACFDRQKVRRTFVGQTDVSNLIFFVVFLIPGSVENDTRTQNNV